MKAGSLPGSARHPGALRGAGHAGSNGPVAARHSPFAARSAARARSIVTGPSAWPALAGLVLGALALGPGLARGFVLSYDMVFVPGPPMSAQSFGLSGGAPRNMPSAVVVAAASRAVPADIVQKLIIILIFVLACSGAAALLGTRAMTAGGNAPPLLARLAAGVFYAWNPFVAERMIIGQWALLLGYAGLPWVVRAVWSGGGRIPPWRLYVSLLPAAVGGFAAMTVSALAAIPVAWCAGADRPARARRLAAVLVALAILSLPWAVPALLTSVHTDPNGVTAFAARADTPFGRVGSLLMLGGIWNAQTVPAGYGGAACAVWLAVVLVAVAGYVLAARPRRMCPGLGVAAIAGFAIAAVGITAPSRAVLRDLIALWPGWAVLRDGQQYLAPLALAEAIGMGAVVARLMREPAAAAYADPAPRADADPAPGADADPAPGRGAAKARPPAARAASALGVMAALAPVLLLPGLAWGAAGRLHSVQYPADWLRARQIIDAGPRQGTAVLLPWAAYRRFPWNRGEAVLDPWPDLLHRPVTWNDALQVGDQTVAEEDPAARRLNPLMSSAGPLTAGLRSAGVRYVIVDAGPVLGDRGPRLAADARLPGAAVVIDSRDLVVFRLPAASASLPSRASPPSKEKP
jgi:hypothetical protein